MNHDREEDPIVKYVLALFVFCAIAGLMWFGFTRLWRWLGSRLFRPDGADAACRFVWCVAYGQTAATMPRTYWIRTKDGSWTDLWGRRVAGQTPHAGACNIAWCEGMKFWRSALPHEYAHALYLRIGVDTSSHEHPAFKPGGLVDKATTALMEWEEDRERNLTDEAVAS